MPRPKAPASTSSSAEPKKRSRTGCWPCKARKVKCGEEKPQCQNCSKIGEECDYSIRLNWGGRSSKKNDAFVFAVNPGSSESPSTSFLGSASTTGAPGHAQGPNGHATLKRSSSNASDGTSVAMPSSLGMLHRSNAPLNDMQHHINHFDQPSQYTHQAMAPDAESAQGSMLPLPVLNQYQGYTQYQSVADGTPNGGDRPPSMQHAHNNRDAMLRQGSPRKESNVQLPPLPRPDLAWSSQPDAKRMRMNDPDFTLPKPVFARPMLPEGNSPHGAHEHPSPSSASFTPFSFNSYLNTPMTPGSSIASEETQARPTLRQNSLSVQESPDVRRLSVNSLLSGPPGDGDQDVSASRARTPSRYPRKASDGYMHYGYDYGQPDLDMPKNNDANAIAPESPAGLVHHRPSNAELDTSGDTTPEIAASTLPRKEVAFGRGGYYAEPVPIKICRQFEPLPHYLSENPMNLLYFHHFINHTGRVLVPHECPNNPMRSTFPQMALKNANLLNLLLAYSASHRARLLGHREPSNRIALWVRDLFPDLRAAISSPEPISDEVLATAIMLSSLEIVSPNTFDVPIKWQNHLQVAGTMIVSRGGIKTLSKSGNKYVAFLCKWFAYLEVIGSLGGNRSEKILSSDYWSFSNDDNPANFQIDCFLGFTTRCIALLALVAKLSQECDAERMDAQGNVRADWQPSEEQREAAAKLQVALETSRQHVSEGCVHSDPSAPPDERWAPNMKELRHSNEMFHWAGLIHLHRRVLGKPTSDKDVQECVSRILTALKTVKRGSSTESCLLFPMFTAGCDAESDEQRECVMERLRWVEGWGIAHVVTARTLMQKVWDTGKPWETLVTGEFFG